MLAAIDLTHKQAARVLEQALRSRARLEIEPRRRRETLTGNLAGREGDFLRVELHDAGRDWSLADLAGAFCDVRTVLSGQLYRFCTCIVTTLTDAVPQAILIAVPEIVQVANRRRYDRKPVPGSRLIEVWPRASREPLVGVLREIGLGGLSCRLPRRDADDFLLIDDPARVRFELPGAGEPFDLGVTVCVKTPTSDRNHLDVGLEFRLPPEGASGDPTLARLHAILTREYSGPPTTEGDT